jgi:nitroreductase
MDLQQAVDWRYGVKKLDPNQTIPEGKLQRILDAVRKTPSPYNFQPWKIIVIEDQQLLDKLEAEAAKQEKVGQASQLVVLAARKSLDEEYIDHLVDITAKQRGQTIAKLDDYRDSLSRSLKKTPEEFFTWSKQQTFIALGFLLLAAAIEEVDAGPMAGFNAGKVDEILGLDESDYGSAVLVALGYRDPSDSRSKITKVRFDADEVIERR